MLSEIQIHVDLRVLEGARVENLVDPPVLLQGGHVLRQLPGYPLYVLSAVLEGRVEDQLVQILKIAVKRGAAIAGCAGEPADAGAAYAVLPQQMFCALDKQNGDALVLQFFPGGGRLCLRMVLFRISLSAHHLLLIPSRQGSGLCLLLRLCSNQDKMSTSILLLSRARPKPPPQIDVTISAKQIEKPLPL